MKRATYILALLLTMSSLSGCSLIGDIFKGGFIFGVILAVIIGLIIWALSSFTSQNLQEETSEPIKL